MYKIYKELKNEINKQISIIKNTKLKMLKSNNIDGIIYNIEHNTDTNLKELLLDAQFCVNNLYTNTDLMHSYFMQTLLGSSNEYNNKVTSEISNLDSITKEVIEILKCSGNSCIVGGFIRSTILNHRTKDIDFVTDIDIEQLNYLFSKNGFIVKDVGNQFLVTIVLKNGRTFEISNYRKDKDNSGGEIGSIQEDAERRDFTVNTLYYNLTSNLLLDPTREGLIDLKNRTLRFVGNSEDRIKEDPNRVFRFYRFLSKGFNPNKTCLSSVRKNFNYCVNSTSSERIRLEIERMI